MELGHFPDTLEGIKALKGVGDYTAAAIGSFAFDIPAAVVDGNVYRVLSRYFGIDTPINSTQGKKSLLRWRNHSCLLRLLSNFLLQHYRLLLPITRA